MPASMIAQPAPACTAGSTNDGQHAATFLAAPDDFTGTIFTRQLKASMQDSEPSREDKIPAAKAFSFSMKRSRLRHST